MTESTLSPIHAASFLSFLLDVSLKSLPIFAAAGLVCLGLRRASAASRHALWLVTVVSLLCLPAFCILLPRWLVPVLPASAQHHAQTSKLIGSRVEEVASQQPLVMKQPPTAGVGKLSPQASPATRSAAFMSSPTPSLSAPDASLPLPVAPVVANPRPITSTTRHPAFIPTMTQLILATWLVGVLMVLARALIGIQAARRLVRRCQKAISGPLADAAEQARTTLGLSFGVAVREGRQGTEVLVPMTFGLLRPVVLLPYGAAGWPAERLRVVMLHEIAHVKRRDWLTTMLAEVACALYWFHPLVWLAAHRLRAESEQACDDLVLTSGVQAVDYANHLLEVVRGLTGRGGSMPAVVTMAQERDLTGRLKTILADSKNRSAATGRGLALAVLAALGTVMPLAAMRPVARRYPVGQTVPSSMLTTPTLADATSAGTASPMSLDAPASASGDDKDAMPAQVRAVAGRNYSWTGTAPDGTKIRLVSLARADPHGGPIHPMWSPDGLPINSRRNTTYDTAVYAFIPEAPASPATLHAFYLKSTPRTPYTLGGVTFRWEGQGRADVNINITKGPFTPLVSGSPRGASRRLATGEVVTLSQVSRFFQNGTAPGGKRVSITVVPLVAPARFISDPCGYALEALGRDGRPVAVQFSSGQPDPGHSVGHPFFEFRTAELAARHVTRFRFMYRPVYALRFRNVALRPDGLVVSQPAVRASTPLAASPMASTGARAVVNAVGGLAQVAKGVSLQLIGVSDQPSNNGRWWRPDGTPFVYQTKVLRVNFNAVPNGTPSSHWSIFMFRLTQPKRDVTLDPWWHPEVQPEGRTPKAGSFAVDHIHGITLSGFVQKVAEGPSSLAMRLRVATGPWQTEQARIKPTQAAITIGRTVSVGQPQKGWIGSYKLHWLSPTSTRVTLTRSTKDEGEEMRVVAVDGQGRRFLPGPSVSNFVGGRIETWYPLSLPLANIKELGIETRPYTAVDFKGVARQPITAARSVAFPSLPAKAQADQDVSEANLHQIGLGIFQYAAAHDQHFPDAAHWMDQIIPYLVPSEITGAVRRQRIASLFHDPAAPAGQTWSYAYNRTLSGLTNSKIDNPNQIVAVFESSHGVRNASDGGQSVPQPGRHSGGTDFLFADGHTKWLKAKFTPLLWAELKPIVIDSSGNLTQPPYTSLWFAPVNPASRQKIPIQGQVYDRRTMRPLNNTFVIFSQSPNKITVGSVWPSSFTNKAGRFQSILYPGKNYLMLLEDNRFRFAGKTLKYEANGNKGSISTQGMKIGPPRSARSDYIVRWSLPQGYSLKASSSPNEAAETTLTAFVPVARAAPR